MHSHARWRHRGLAHEQSFANDPYDQHSRYCSCARVNHDQLPQAINPQSATTSARCAAGSDGMRSAPLLTGPASAPSVLLLSCFTDDSVSHLLLISNAVGFAAGTTARNSSRPSIAIAQVSFILLPIVVGSALHPGVAYAVLSAITALYYLATIEIAQYLGRNCRDLLLMTRSQSGACPIARHRPCQHVARLVHVRPTLAPVGMEHAFL